MTGKEIKNYKFDKDLNDLTYVNTYYSERSVRISIP